MFTMASAPTSPVTSHRLSCETAEQVIGFSCRERGVSMWESYNFKKFSFNKSLSNIYYIYSIVQKIIFVQSNFGCKKYNFSLAYLTYWMTFNPTRKAYFNTIKIEMPICLRRLSSPSQKRLERDTLKEKGWFLSTENVIKKSQLAPCTKKNPNRPPPSPFFSLNKNNLLLLTWACSMCCLLFLKSYMIPTWAQGYIIACRTPSLKFKTGTVRLSPKDHTIFCKTNFQI